MEDETVFSDDPVQHCVLGPARNIGTTL